MYDFGYLMRVLMNSELPTQEDDFFDLVKLFFPVIYDIKVLVANQFRGGLQELSQALSVIILYSIFVQYYCKHWLPTVNN